MVPQPLLPPDGPILAQQNGSQHQHAVPGEPQVRQHLQDLFSDRSERSSSDGPVAPTDVQGLSAKCRCSPAIVIGCPFAVASKLTFVQADTQNLNQGMVHGVPAYDISQMQSVSQIQSWINALGTNSAALSTFPSQGTILMPSSLTHQQAAAAGEPRASPPFQGTGPPPVLDTEVSEGMVET